MLAYSNAKITVSCGSTTNEYGDTVDDLDTVYTDIPCKYSMRSTRTRRDDRWVTESVLQVRLDPVYVVAVDDVISVPGRGDWVVKSGSAVGVFGAPASVLRCYALST